MANTWTNLPSHNTEAESKLNILVPKQPVPIFMTNDIRANHSDGADTVIHKLMDTSG